MQGRTSLGLCGFINDCRLDNGILPWRLYEYFLDFLCSSSVCCCFSNKQHPKFMLWARNDQTKNTPWSPGWQNHRVICCQVFSDTDSVQAPCWVGRAVHRGRRALRRADNAGDFLPHSYGHPSVFPGPGGRSDTEHHLANQHLLFNLACPAFVTKKLKFNTKTHISLY